MADFDIKISQLDPITPAANTEDFFPLVHSSSMTTYRASLQDIGSLMTHSVYSNYSVSSSWASSSLSSSQANYANNALSSSWASSSLSSSLANTASYAATASVALNSTPNISSSWASMSFQSSFSTQSLYSTQSIYATYSLETNLTGNNYYFPFWLTHKIGGFETNGCLISDPSNQGSPSIYQSALYNYEFPPNPIQNIIVAGPQTIFQAPQIANPNRPDYLYSSSWNVIAFGNPYGPGPIPYGGVAGIYSPGNIISDGLIGTDMMLWWFTASAGPIPPGIIIPNTFWSGSNFSGSWVTIPATLGGISSSFNKKWVRIASAGQFSAAPYNTVAAAASRGEVSSNNQHGFFGRLKVWVHGNSANPSGASNGSEQMIDMEIFNHIYAGGTSATVLYSAQYGNDWIKKIRISNWSSATSDTRDPQMSVDLFIDHIQGDIVEFDIGAASWSGGPGGGVKFLQVLNVDPDPLFDTGSANPGQASYLIIPPSPGHYGTYSNTQDYHIQGHNVIIDPTYNKITQSTYTGPDSKGNYGYVVTYPYSLQVSGTINSNGYYCENKKGLSGSISIGGTVLYFDGGILVKSVPAGNLH
jgi:hypothetical protein